MENVKGYLVANFALEVPVPRSNEVFNHFKVYALHEVLFFKSGRVKQDTIVELLTSYELASVYLIEYSKKPVPKRLGKSLYYISPFFVNGPESYDHVDDKLGILSRNVDDLYFL